MSILVTCACGKQFKVKDELAGKRGKCAACGQVLSVPTLAPSLEQVKASPSPLRACPTCEKALEPDSVICLNCGHDLRTGKQLSNAKSSVSFAPAVTSSPSANEPASSARLWIALIAGGICLAGVVVTVALFSPGRGSKTSALATQPNSGAKNAFPTAQGTGASAQSHGTPAAAGQKTTEAPKASGASPLMAQQVPAASQPFEEAFRAERIVWEPVKNVDVEIKTADGSKRVSSVFRVKFKYDANGIQSIDTTGYKTYTWPGRQATFGPGAVIKITNTFNVLEGELKGGDQWVWDGTNWLPKRVVDDRLAKSEARVIEQLGGLPVSLVLRDPNASMDQTLDNVYAKFNERPGDVQAKIKACLEEPKCLPAVVILKHTQELGDIEKRLGRYQEKQDQMMLFPTDGGGREAKPVYWYRYGRFDVGVDFRSPVIVAVRILAADY